MNKKQTVIIFPIIIVIISILISLVFVFKNDSTNDQNIIKNEKNTENKEKKENKDTNINSKWPTSELAMLLPIPNNELEAVHDYSCDYYKSTGIDVNCNDRNDYLEYIEQCKNKGFTYDIKSSDVKNDGLLYSSFFSSYNKDGVYLLIVYDDGDFVYENGNHTNKNYSITIKEPITCNLIWENGHRSGMIPQPNTSTGFIRSDDGLFEAMVSNMSHDDFLEYIDLCSKKFNAQFEKVDVSESYDYSDEEYQATVDELDGTLSISYTGFSNVMIRCI